MKNSEPQRPAHGPADAACREVFERLSEFLDGELTPADCAHIEEHIRDCAPCVAFLDSLKSCIRAAHGLGAGQTASRPLPADVQEKLRAAWQAALQRRGA
jgi:predicted anti-sigma-YlaC factor YlaD